MDKPTLPPWMREDAARHLVWFRRYRPRVIEWLDDMLPRLDDLIQKAEQIENSEMPEQHAQDWLRHFVSWSEVYRTRLYNHWLDNIAPNLPDPDYDRALAGDVLKQSVSLLMSCQQMLMRRGSTKGVHALASCIAWQSSQTLVNWLSAMTDTDDAMTDVLKMIGDE